MDTVVLLGIKMTATLLAMLGDFKTDLLARTYLKIWLFQGGGTIGPDTHLDQLTPCDFAGYAPITVASINGPALDSEGNAYMTTPEVYFACLGGGTPNQVVSAALVGTTPGGVRATATTTIVAGGLGVATVTLGGGPYTTVPHVTVSGDGTGGVAHAVLTAGVVTSIVVDDVGSGYTAATYAIDPPVDIIVGKDLESARPMILSTDALPLVMEIDLPQAA